MEFFTLRDGDAMLEILYLAPLISVIHKVNNQALFRPFRPGFQIQNQAGSRADHSQKTLDLFSSWIGLATQLVSLKCAAVYLTQIVSLKCAAVYLRVHHYLEGFASLLLANSNAK